MINDSDSVRCETIIEKCMTIAKELNTQRGTDPYFPGTLDDERMEQDFAELFGRDHIGTGATSPREKLLNWNLLDGELKYLLLLVNMMLVQNLQHNLLVFY